MSPVTAAGLQLKSKPEIGKLETEGSTSEVKTSYFQNGQIGSACRENPSVTGLSLGGTPNGLSQLQQYEFETGQRKGDSKKPIAYDLFSGLGGWTEGLLAEGYDVTGYDIEAHEYDDQKYPARLVLRDVLTIHGSEFADADLIVASPPCQAYSYMAMPWSRAKQIAAALRGKGKFPDAYTGPRTIDDLNALFNACFRIQREACEAAGRYIPMVVENVKGAQPWVGAAKAHFGSFYLWGDVEMVGDRVIAGGLRWESVRAAKRGGQKVEGFNFHEHAKTGKPGRSFQSAAVKSTTGGSALCRDRPKESRWSSWHDYGDGYDQPSEAVNCAGDWFGSGADCSLPRKASSRSQARKAASAKIAKIPLPLSSYIARAYKP